MIEFPRGDTYCFKFQRKDNDGNVITSKPDKMWFTVKKNYTAKDVSIQKTLGEGIEYNEEDHFYRVTIENEDTRDLKYGEYVYDIQTKIENVITTISLGTINLTEEVTFDYE